MSSGENRRVVLEERPHYTIPTPDCFRVTSGAMPEPAAGELLLRTLWLSMDVYLLSKVKRFSPRSEPLALGDTMTGFAIAQVVSSRVPEFAPGDLVMGVLPWSEYSVSEARRVRKLTAHLPRTECALSAFGFAGFTAYLSVNVVGAARHGQTVVIGSANSGLGQIAAQIAKRQGCRVVGVSLGEHRITTPPSQLGFDAYVDSLSESFAKDLKASCPDGVDLYIELVGGDVLNATLPLLNRRARIVVAGLKELYTSSELPEGGDKTMLFLNQVMTHRLSVQGVVVFDHVKERFPTFVDAMVEWLRNGQMNLVEDVVEGLENAPRAFQRVFESSNYGHIVVRVA